jgi:hypothetical protein
MNNNPQKDSVLSPLLATIQRHIQQVEEIRRTFEHYETPLLPRECKDAIGSLRALKDALDDLEERLPQLGALRIPAILITVVGNADRGAHAADDLILNIVCYAPVCQSMAKRNLQRRQEIARALPDLITKVEKVLSAFPEVARAATIGETKPSYLQVLRSDDENNNEPPAEENAR